LDHNIIALIEKHIWS